MTEINRPARKTKRVHKRPTVQVPPDQGVDEKAYRRLNQVPAKKNAEKEVKVRFHPIRTRLARHLSCPGLTPITTRWLAVKWFHSAFTSDT